MGLRLVAIDQVAYVLKLLCIFGTEQCGYGPCVFGGFEYVCEVEAGEFYVSRVDDGCHMVGRLHYDSDFPVDGFDGYPPRGVRHG
jgi:hypothetical protein